MKMLWLILLLVSASCAGFGKVADNLTAPPAAESTAAFVDGALSGVPGPGGIDLGDAGIGGGIVGLIGLVSSLFRTNQRVTKAKREIDELYDETRPPVTKRA